MNGGNQFKLYNNDRLVFNVQAHLRAAFQPPPGYSARTRHRMPERHHPPVGTLQAAGPDPRHRVLPESGHGPGKHQSPNIYLHNIDCVTALSRFVTQVCKI